MAPPACDVASISSVGGVGYAQDANLVNEKFESFALTGHQIALGGDILQACVMVAGGDDSSPAAVLLRGGGAHMNADESASLSSRSVIDVPVEQPVIPEAIQKGLHDRQATVNSSTPAPNEEPGVKGVCEDAIVDTQKVVEAFPELNNRNHENSRELNTKSNEDRDEHLEVPDAIESDGPTAKGCVDGTEDSGVAAVVSDANNVIEEGDENSPAATVISGVSALAIADAGADVASNNAAVNVSSPDSLEPIQTTCGSSDDDDHLTIPEFEYKPADSSERQAAEVSEQHDPRALDMNGSKSELIAKKDTCENIFEGDINVADMHSPSKVDVHLAFKVELSSTESANIDEVPTFHNAATNSRSFSFTGLNHVAFCVENLERSLGFYSGLLGLKTNIDRPDLPYRGAWLFLGAEGIHLMEVPNPDPVSGRPGHGGFDRHACLNCKNVEGVRLALEQAGIPYQPSMVPSIFTRDPDGNGLEFIEVGS